MNPLAEHAPTIIATIAVLGIVFNAGMTVMIVGFLRRNDEDKETRIRSLEEFKAHTEALAQTDAEFRARVTKRLWNGGPDS